MKFIELALKRKSIRKYKENAEVTKEQLDEILKAAQHAPSAGNKQPWHFYVIRDAAVKGQLCEAAYGQGMLTSAPVVIAVIADKERCAERYEDRGRELYCLQDTAAAIQNMLLCACDLGLGTCWMGAYDEAEVVKTLDLKENMRPVALISLGVPAMDPAPRGRREIDEIVTYIG